MAPGFSAQNVPKYLTILGWHIYHVRAQYKYYSIPNSYLPKKNVFLKRH